MPITQSTETFGPKEAMAALSTARYPDGTFKNRKIDPRRVNNLSREMSTPGNYFPQLPTIAYGVDNTLKGGFHTLHAIVDSGTTWELRVLRGLPEEATPSLNEQRSGNASDELRRRGVSDYNQKAAIITAWLNFVHGRPTMFTGKHYTAREIADVAEATPQLIGAVTYGGMLYRTIMRPNKTATGVSYLLMAEYIGEDPTQQFFSEVVNGVDLKAGTPEAAVRHFLEVQAIRLHRRANSTIRQFANNRLVYGFLRACKSIVNEEPLREIHAPTKVTTEQLRKIIEKFASGGVAGE